MKFSQGLLGAGLVLLGLPVWAAEPAPKQPANPPAASAPAEADTAKAEGKLPLNDLRNFVNAMEAVRSSYVEPVDDKTLFEYAIRGMLSSLDPHSSYMDSKEFQDLQQNIKGKFGGVGLEVGMEDGLLKVVTPIDGTPAARAGIKSGDFIIKLDDKAVKGMNQMDAINYMRGKPGSKLRLVVQTPGQEPRDIELLRAEIEVTSVRSRFLESGFLLVRISQFQENTGRDLKRELETQGKKGPIKGIIMDLRNNPGGELTNAVEVADAFLDDGMVVSMRGRVAGTEQKFFAKPGQVLPGVPLVVLVNGGSASASEIVSGALQDNKRALIVGTLTFGKGSVQTVLPLLDDTGIKLTTARYYTPSGRSIQAEGIKPDILVEQAKLTAFEGGDLFHESDLQGHLANPGKSDDGAKAVAKDDKAKDDKAKDDKAKDEKSKDADAAKDSKGKVEKLESRDYQMYAALNILKGVSFAQQASPAPVKAETAPTNIVSKPDNLLPKKLTPKKK